MTPSPLSFLGAPPPHGILRRVPSPCHSEARTPKNLRCWLTRRTIVVMDRPSEGDIRFLTPFGMTVRGIRNALGVSE